MNIPQLDIPEQTSKGKSLIKVELPHKVISLAIRAIMCAIDGEAKLILMKAVGQEAMATALKTLHHAKW